MENAIKGWEYISVIFQRMIDLLKENENLIEPQLIYRGITRRYFSSSNSITELLNKEPDFIINNTHRRTEKDDSHEAYKILYNKFYQRYKDEIKKGNPSSTDVLKQLMTCDEYQYISPEYIKSGAAIRMQNIKNRSHIDYVNYIKYLINDAKSRFCEYAEKYSDIEILADIQHKGGASCLVDFSNNFLISLWFATQTNRDDKEFGYLFCYDVNSEMIEKDNLSMLSYTRSKKCIEDLLYATSKSERYNEERSYRFWLWKPSILNERIARQDSVFVFGLNPFNIKEHGIIVIPIPPDWKIPIQVALKSYFGITEQFIFGDNNGFATSHDKTKPYEPVMSHYFNEQSANRNLILYDLQNGMACLFQEEYDLALKYFSSFESGPKYKIAKKATNTIRIDTIENTMQDIKMLIIDIELHFSKALCLKHLNHKFRAIEEYDFAKNNCASLIKQIDNITEYWENVQPDNIERIERLKCYAITKYQKTAKDLMDLLYDTKQYAEILNLIDSIKDTLPTLSKPLFETIVNEVKSLEALTNHINNDKNIDSSVVQSETSGNIQPFCYVLNQYFICILESVKRKRVDKGSLELLLTKIERKKFEDYNKGFYFTKWDFSDIKSILEYYKIHNLNLYNALIAITSQVEEFMEYVNSKIKIRPY